MNRNPNGPLGSGAPINESDASNPFRLSPAQARTSDQDHEDLAEQIAYDNGKMDSFPSSTGRGAVCEGLWKKLGHGLLRRQYRHGAVELCATFRAERQ